MLNKILTGLICMFLANTALSDNPCNVMKPRGGDGDWGIGCYLIPDEFRIKVYDDDDGSIFGELFTKNSHIYLLDKNKNVINIEYEDIEYIGSYRNELVKIKECFNPDFVRVLWKTSKRILFLNKRDLETAGARFKKYKDILFDKSIKEKYTNYDLNIGVNVKKSCLNLRKDPTINAMILICIKGNDWEKGFGSGIRIKEVKGNWAKIEYFEMHSKNDAEESDDDCSYNEKNNKIGWIKAIGDDGFPNIWFSV
jgi:hypothetical protein